MTSTKRNLIIAGIVVLALVCAYFVYDSFHTRQQMREMEEVLTFEKDQLEDEYQNLAIQFDGYGKNIKNDSLAELLSREQHRVQDLLEELRITKATNARRIAELKKELASVRAVMVEYVHQIDSLSRTNAHLRRENQQVKEQYELITEHAENLEKENAELGEVVSRASMLEVTDFKFTPLNSKDKKTKSYNKIRKLEFQYNIEKNATATRGEKTVYLRLTQPDGEVMQKQVADTFHYENSSIAYSVKKQFEYSGDRLSDVLYWNVSEILQEGWYNADFFVDDNLVGSFPFKIEK